MEHRNQVILRKVLSEIDIASQFLSDCTLEEFVADELLKRAVCMTVINIGELKAGNDAYVLDEIKQIKKTTIIT